MTLATGSRLRALLAGCALAALAPLAAAAEDAAAASDHIILLINPNSNEKTTQSMTEIAATATGGVTVEGKSNEGVPPLLTTPADLAAALPGVVRIGVEAAKDDRVGAIIVAAFGDPGLAELRAEVDLPVFGIREQAFREAAEGGRPFGIATTTPDPGLAEAFRQTAAALGYADQFRGTRATPGDPNALMAKSPEELDAALAEAVQASIADGAEAVIIGGGPLTASALRLQPQFDIPLVIPVIAAAQAAAEAVKAD
ncbi:aspartate/glutamate racemase family protein [Amaricoccus sp.]|uniref:aspartate/glutamate racemase family protein n=1 Tax=Amaricoccus sp. TaxID=1872485 RepID=UPI002610EB1F|nr:aspartate/glutamate racemase family protein [Amaricoccus sp.]HRO11239.1 aspartate/glutamate racemase family protein [Amaricoccus sp.]